MTNITTTSSIALVPGLEAAWQDVDSSFDRFCLVAGIGAMEQVLCEDAQRLTGPRHGRGGGQRWGMTKTSDRISESPRRGDLCALGAGEATNLTREISGLQISRL
jgi:hypothetical protein